MRVCLLTTFFVLMSLPRGPVLADDPFGVREQFAIKFGFADSLEIDAQIYLPMLKQALTAELHFAKRICQPDEDQFDKIHTAGAEAVASVANAYADNTRRRIRAESWTDPNEAIADALVKSIQQVMPSDVADRYAAESKARFEANRAANAALLINVIDRQLCLSVEQQAKLYATFRDNWQPHWSTGNVLLMYPNYALLPEASVLRPHLTERQKTLWATSLVQRRVSLSWQLRFGISNLFGTIGLPEFEPPEMPGADASGPGGEKE